MDTEAVVQQGRIERLGVRGDGVLQGTDGNAVMIPFALAGETIRYQPTGTVGGSLRGRLIELITPSADRADPPCRHFGQCGGCSMQHLATAPYLDWKHQIVAEAMAHHDLDCAIIAPVRATEPGQRRRTVLHARAAAGAPVVLGFKDFTGGRIEALQMCSVLQPALVALLPAIGAMLNTLLPVNETADVVLTSTDTGVDLVLATSGEPTLAALQYLSGFADDNDLARISTQGTGSQTLRTVATRRPPSLTMGRWPIALTAGSFVQANAAADAILRDLVVQAVPPAKPVLDLYSGCGTFTFTLAAAGLGVDAYEADGDVVEALTADARRHGLNRVSASRRNLVRRPLRPAELAGHSVVLNPPRAGAAPQCAALAQSDVETVVYVSCNPKTFARDARQLNDSGLRLVSVVPVDQFLWSPHVELVATFRR